MLKAVLLVPFFAGFLLQAQDLPEGKGKDVVEASCGACHGMDLIVSQKNTKEGWTSVVEDMGNRGADIDGDKKNVIIDYLVKNFGKESGDSKISANKR